MPDIGVMDALTAQYQAFVGQSQDGADNTLTAENTVDSNAVPTQSAKDANATLAETLPDTVADTVADAVPATAANPYARQSGDMRPDFVPQGSAAVRAALAYKTDAQKQFADVLPASMTNTNTSPVSEAVAVPVPRAEKPAQEDVSWWDNVLSMTSLPIPRLGVDQVAYAATLDTPLMAPPPPSPQTGTVSTFTPPAQVLPAGVAGPKTGMSATENLLVPNTNPPAPNLDAYVPPEDPNRKEQELARREQEILMLKRQMEQRLQELQSAEQKVQGMLKEAKGVEANKVTTLTDMYSNMKPRQAGAALENLDENIAAKILVSMKSKQAGEILSYMDPVKTAKLTELLSRMRLQ